MKAADAPGDLFKVALARSARRLGLKVTKRWATVDMRDLDASWPTFLRSASIVAQDEYEVSTREALLYLMAVLQQADLPIPGEPLPRPWRQDHITSLLRLTGPIHMKELVSHGYTEQAAYLSGLRRTVRWLQGDMYRESNQTVIEASHRFNEQAGYTILQGYERVPEPTACGFCRMLAGASRKHSVFRVTKEWRTPHPGCKCEIKPLPVYRTERVLTAREIALNKAMYESIKASRDRALKQALAA